MAIYTGQINNSNTPLTWIGWPGNGSLKWRYPVSQTLDYAVEVDASKNVYLTLSGTITESADFHANDYPLRIWAGEYPFTMTCSPGSTYTAPASADLIFDTTPNGVYQYANATYPININRVYIGNLSDPGAFLYQGNNQYCFWIGGVGIYPIVDGGTAYAIPIPVQGMFEGESKYIPWAVLTGGSWRSCNRSGGTLQRCTGPGAWELTRNQGLGMTIPSVPNSVELADANQPNQRIYLDRDIAGINTRPWLRSRLEPDSVTPAEVVDYEVSVTHIDMGDFIFDGSQSGTNRIYPYEDSATPGTVLRTFTITNTGNVAINGSATFAGTTTENRFVRISNMAGQILPGASRTVYVEFPGGKTDGNPDYAWDYNTAGLLGEHSDTIVCNFMKNGGAYITKNIPITWACKSPAPNNVPSGLSVALDDGNYTLTVQAQFIGDVVSLTPPIVLDRVFYMGVNVTNPITGAIDRVITLTNFVHLPTQGSISAVYTGNITVEQKWIDQGWVTHGSEIYLYAQTLETDVVYSGPYAITTYTVS